MKIANMDLDAFPYLPGTAAAPMVKLQLSLGAFFAKAVDATPDQARELAAQLLTAANLAEGKDAEAAH